jgi:hypothetical protein
MSPDKRPLAYGYGLKTAGDLLSKLRRDRERLRKQITPDRFFNFVVTGYHIIDWIKHDPSVPQSAKNDRGSMFDNPHVQICQDLANASKHFELDPKRARRDPVVEKTSAVSNFAYGTGAYGEGPYGGGESVVIVLAEGKRIDALRFADAVVEAWEAFFAKHAVEVPAST